MRARMEALADAWQVRAREVATRAEGTALERCARELREALAAPDDGPAVRRERERQGSPGAHSAEPLNLVVAKWLDEDEALAKGGDR